MLFFSFIHMIQRIQTIYLIIVVLLFVLSFIIPIVDFTSTQATLTLQYYIAQSDTINLYAWPSAIVALLIIVLSLITIFKFNNRLIQIKYCNIISILILAYYIALIGQVVLFSNGVNEITINWNPFIVLPFLALPFTILAKRAIRADERLVRSSERLR